MKKIISYMLLVALVFNVFAMNVFAADTTITAEITGAASASEAENKGDVNIKITSTAGKDLLIKIIDVADNNKVIYLDSVLEDENNTIIEVPVADGEGTETKNVKITNITLDKEDIGFKTFKIIVSESSAAKEFEFTTTKYSSGGSTGSSGGNTTNNNTSGWDDDTNKNKDDKEENEIKDQKTGEKQGDADKDTLNEGAIQGAAKQTTASGGAKYIENTTKATSAEAMTWESTRNTIAVSVETMMANISSKKISTSSTTNKLVLKESSISDADLKKYTDTEKTLNDAMNKNKITLNRELSKEYIVNTTFSTTKKANITIHKGFVTKLEKVGIETLTINDKNFRVSYSMTELKAMLGDKDSVSFDIDTTAMTSSTKKLSVSFDTDKTQSVKISFPGLSSDAKYMAIVDENGNPVGGRYNPATGAIEAKISESGVYQIVNNEKDFDDIKHLSEEMQESIKILAAKGIIEGTSAKEFSPEDSISRAEVAALLLRVLSQVDPNADGGFTDVKKSDWFYGTAGSAKAYGMILGFEDNTFRGNVTIAKDQILAIASRVLQREMKYITPEKPEEWLTFADATSIADWAANDIALTTMANIVTRTADNTIHANEDMTRGDAALIIMRLFYKIW